MRPFSRTTKLRCVSSGLSLVVFLSLGLGMTRTYGQSPSIVPLPPAGISFSGLSGPNLAPYLGSVEGNFAVTPTAGAWLQGTFYGNPAGSIVDGPIMAPGLGVIQITSSAGLFTLAGFDFSSNNGDSTYDILGILGSTVAYHETGTLPGTFGPFSFSTLFTANPSVPVDGIFIGILPGPDTTSVNLDNIEVATATAAIPDLLGPLFSILFLGSGLTGLICYRAKREY
jgi:hypothetical protein